MDTTYKQNEMKVYKIVVQLGQMLKKMPFDCDPEWQKCLSEIEQQFQTRKFRMAVVGEFNRGKSSFINVLLGKKILPEDIRAATATINRITYGETPKAYLIMKDAQKKSQEIPVEELASYVTKLTKESEKAASAIREAVVEYPTMLCYNDVDLIDTPGMNDEENMNAVTVNQLEDIDLAVVAINAQYPYSETENHFVVKLLENNNICQIIFVITHFDMIRDREKEKLMNFLRSRISDNVLKVLKNKYSPDDIIFHKYHFIFDNLHIYGVSSVSGMEALENNDMELYEESGFLQISKELPQVILSSRSINMIDNAVCLLEKIIGECHTELSRSKNDIQKMEKLRSGFIDLIKRLLEELIISAKETVYNTFQRETQQREEAILQKFLFSLGQIEAFETESVLRAMMPTIKQEFKGTNSVYKNLKNQILHNVTEQSWREIISRFMSQLQTQLGDDPFLLRFLPTFQSQNEKILNLLQKQGADDKSSQDTYVFYWIDSPIKAILNTKVNHSVLPEFRKIIHQSLDTCTVNIEKDLNTYFAGIISEIEKELNSVRDFLNEVPEANEKADVYTSLIEELDALQKECKSLHKL